MSDDFDDLSERTQAAYGVLEAMETMNEMAEAAAQHTAVSYLSHDPTMKEIAAAHREVKRWLRLVDEGWDTDHRRQQAAFQMLMLKTPVMKLKEDYHLDDYIIPNDWSARREESQHVLTYSDVTWSIFSAAEDAGWADRETDWDAGKTLFAQTTRFLDEFPVYDEGRNDYYQGDGWEKGNNSEQDVGESRD